MLPFVWSTRTQVAVNAVAFHYITVRVRLGSRQSSVTINITFLGIETQTSIGQNLRKHILAASVGLLSLILLVGTAILVGFPLQFAFAPRIPGVRAGTSLNWSGYAVTGSDVSDAKGSWKVPAIVGACPSSNQYSSFWVGIDGYSSSTVEQTGTDSDCQNGSPTYYAWYEFYPKPSFIISSLTITPGDIISADVQYSPATGKFTVTIMDTTTGQSFSTSAKVSAQRSSAEWIAEAPSSGGTVLPLADFGTAYYGLDNTGISSTCYATVGSVTGSIGSFGSSVQQISMVTSSGAVQAQPSSLSNDGTSFSVQWGGGGTSTPSLSVSANPSTITTTQSSTITASTSDSATGVTISFSTNLGSLSPTSCTTDTTGACSVSFSSTGTGTATIMASASGYNSARTTVTVTSTSTTTLSISVTTDKPPPNSYTTNSWAYITVTVTANGSPVSGASITLTVTNPNGGTSQGSATTNSSGQATFKYRIGPNAPLGTYMVNAQASAAGYTSGSGLTTFTVT